MTYAAYVRIYGPVSAFHEPGRSRRAEYAASPGRPPDGAARGERGLAVAMYLRARRRGAFADFEQVN